MSKCILNVTPREYDKILQYNHDKLEWSNRDRSLLNRLAGMFDRQLIHDIRQFEECRMEKHNDMGGLPRIQPRRSPH